MTEIDENPETEPTDVEVEPTDQADEDASIELTDFNHDTLSVMSTTVTFGDYDPGLVFRFAAPEGMYLTREDCRKLYDWLYTELFRRPSTNPFGGTATENDEFYFGLCRSMHLHHGERNLLAHLIDPLENHLFVELASPSIVTLGAVVWMSAGFDPKRTDGSADLSPGQVVLLLGVLRTLIEYPTVTKPTPVVVTAPEPIDYWSDFNPLGFLKRWRRTRA